MEGWWLERDYFREKRYQKWKQETQKCLVYSEDGQHLLGLQVHIHELWVDIRLANTFRLYLKCHYQVHLSVTLRCWDIYLGGIRVSFQVFKQNIDLIKAIGKFKWNWGEKAEDISEVVWSLGKVDLPQVPDQLPFLLILLPGGNGGTISLLMMALRCFVWGGQRIHPGASLRSIT